MANGAGWRPDPDPDLDDDVDPERPGQERYWEGSLWTDRVRPAGGAGPPDGQADHVPQLHRAMSAAAADLDAVDDRISTLFERPEGPRPAGTAPRGREAAAGAARAGASASEVRPDEDDADNEDADFIALFEDVDAVATTTGDEVSEDVIVVSRLEVLSEYQEMTSGTFPELNAELAGVEHDQTRVGKAKRRIFRRRATGTTAFKR